MFDINDLIFDLEDDDIFEEKPVDIDTFMGKGYLEQFGVTLSHYQKEMIEHSTQIYNYDTLVYLYGEERAKELDRKNVREVIAMVGKGSGKDFCAEISCAYVVYKLMCLKDPSKYFGKPPGDSIDIVNIAVNADQARNVFFKGLTRMIKGSPWFAGKFDARQRDISFDKNITIYSGHSEAEAFEGLNLFMAILDEIAGFEHAGRGSDTDASPAQAIYDMYDASISSRFGDNGKLILLSFPRQKGDFIESRYSEVVGEVNKSYREHTFVMNPELSPDAPGNSFTIQWTIDHIISYREAKVWALRRPSWDVNPTKSVEDYRRDFYREPNKALGKFAAEPQESVGGFFDDHEQIDAFSSGENGLDENNVFHRWFLPSEDEDARYFIHVDLAQKHDRCVVSMAHVTGWKRTRENNEEFVPVVKVDAIRYWTPTSDKQVDFAEVREYVMSLVRRGFPIKKITFDQWNSNDMINYFNRLGIEAGVLSVGLAHYMDLKIAIAERRATAPQNDILRRELKQLFITKNGKNVDHPRTKEGSKDIADAVCGSIYNAISLTPKKTAHVYDVRTVDDYVEDDWTAPNSRGIIDPPRAHPDDKVPVDIARYIGLI